MLKRLRGKHHWMNFNPIGRMVGARSMRELILPFGIGSDLLELLCIEVIFNMI